MSSHYQEAMARLEPVGPEWLRGVRAQAAHRFQELGFPTRRHEAWKHTPLDALGRIPFRVEAPSQPGTAQLELPDEHPRVVFVDGVLSEVHRPDLLGGAWLGPLSERWEDLSPWLTHRASTQGRAMVALNTALFTEGAALVLPRGTWLHQPVHLVSVITGAAAGRAILPRFLVVAERESGATVVEHHLGGQVGAFVNSVTEVDLGACASLHHLLVQEQGPQTHHLGSVHARVDREARYRLDSLATGGRLGRLTAEVDLVGRSAEVELTGLALAAAQQTVDHTLVVRHQAERTRSRQLFKTIASDQSSGVFNGLVEVARQAPGADVGQTSRGLLLSDRAAVHARPQLLIDIDDVSASHGATVGQLDGAALFYLRSRGLSEARARRLLTRAFAGEVVERWPEGWLRDRATRSLDAWLEEQ